MIAYAAENQKQNVINCWKTAFPNDSEPFVKFYFEKKYRNEDTLLYFKDEKMAASLQMLPYKMTYYGHFINTSYISGAATVPQCQNQGLMKKLLVHAFKEMKKRGDVLTTLIPQEPWLIDYYKKFAYVPCFAYELSLIDKTVRFQSANNLILRKLQTSDLQKSYLFYKKHFEAQNLCVQKSYGDFAVMVEECQLFEGNVYLLENEAELCGLCFCFFTNEKTVLKDCIAKNEDYQQYFLSKLAQKFNNQSVFLYSPVSQRINSVFLGMARIIDAPKMLALFAQAHPHLEFSVKITDDYISENNVAFFISNGTCKDVACSVSAVDFELPVEKLTQLLLGCQISSLEGKYAVFPEQYPYMSLMLE
ncbi:MAG: GNAT family N-acetyltransferase [Lentimicrobiaceae bacterium]|nr:GNAT family N-acetyltransferase [Lentimicrobiaceae bacterium]